MTGTSTAGDPGTPPPMMPEPPPGPICGNNILEPGEQCDDGNRANLDGCDATCRFEQVLRFNALRMLFNTDSLCPANAIGRAIGSSAQDTLQTNIAGAVADGSISTLCMMRELRALDGSDTSATVGCVTGSPVADARYNGASDLDWWYHASPGDLDADLLPRAHLSATLHSGMFTAGPGDLVLSLNLGGGSSQLSLSSVIVRAGLGAASIPRQHLTLPRGHRSEEHLDPQLASFASLSSGELCGDVSAASLTHLPVPEVLREGGEHACWEGYTEANSMLDVLVGGCSIFFVTPISATQPDHVNRSVPAAGAGGPYRLSAGGDRAVNACRDARGRSVSLSSCLNAAAYSVAILFTADRVQIIGVE